MKKLSILAALIVVAGCMVGPDYRRPVVAIPPVYKEAGDWKSSAPNDQAPRGNWWEIYGDAQLNEMVTQVAISNQNVLAAAAQYRQAMALLGAEQAAYYPALDANLNGSRAQGAASSASGVSAAPGNTVRLSLSASWEADIWGRIGRNVESGKATAQADSAQLQAALLSAQATLIQTYFQVRVDDAELQLLRQTSTAYERSLQITRNRYDEGVAARVDVAQAEAQLKSAQAQVIDLGLQRTQLEHAIAVLIGKTPADFQLKPVDGLPELPLVPAALPSELLERRPDIAAAERLMAAANAQIGIAQAARFPTLTFSGSGGFQNTSLSQLLTLPNRFWSLGPALAFSVFDAGALSAQKQAAVASYDKSVANYRQTVLAAFQEVEDNLAALRELADEAAVQQAAARSAEEVVVLTQNQYEAGTVSYLNVVSAQATALTAESSIFNIAGRRLIANATLIKALGGHWQEGRESVR